MALTKIKNIVGQNQAKGIFFRSLAKDTLSHAYIFRGPSGVGKKTFALSVATFLNCRNRKDDDFCGTCSSCLKFASGNHPDYYFMNPEGGTIKIAQVRELKKKLTFPPFEADYRVILFPDIHVTMSRREVANSLLKILEEPPGHTIFILTADGTGEVLPTILSRGQTVRFMPLDYEEVAAILSEIEGVSNDEASTLAAVTGGSLGDALALADQKLLNLRALLVEGLLECSQDQAEAVEKVLFLAEQISSLKEEIVDFFFILRLWFRDLILLALLHKDDFVINLDLRHTHQRALDRWGVSEMLHKLTLLDTAKKQLDRNCNRGSICEVLLWDLL